MIKISNLINSDLTKTIGTFFRKNSNVSISVISIMLVWFQIKFPKYFYVKMMNPNKTTVDPLNCTFIYQSTIKEIKVNGSKLFAMGVDRRYSNMPEYSLLDL